VNTDTAYFFQLIGGSTSDVLSSGPVNQAIRIFSDVIDDNIDLRNVFKIYLREPGKTYAYYDLIEEQEITQLTYKKYTLPLTNRLDANIINTDIQIDANSDGTADVGIYAGMTITVFPSSVTIGTSTTPFSISIDANGGTINQVYTFIQWALRQSVNIDNGPSSSLLGLIAEEMVLFNGSKLRTLRNNIGGVVINNIATSEFNKIEFTNDNGNIITYPFRTTIQLIFNEVLRNDVNSKYVLFFTNDDAGDNTSRDFGTSNAIVIRDVNNAEIRGTVSGTNVITVSYDYDGNIQRGNASAGVVVQYTAIAIGRTNAKYTISSGEIIRTDINTINLNSVLDVFRT